MILLWLFFLLSSLWIIISFLNILTGFLICFFGISMFFWSPGCIWVLDMCLTLAGLLLLKSLNFLRIASCRCLVKDFGAFSWKTVFSNRAIRGLLFHCLLSTYLFDLVSRVLHQLYDFLQFVLPLWSTWVYFNDLRLSLTLTSFTHRISLHWLLLRGLLSHWLLALGRVSLCWLALVGSIHHSFHDFFHHISMVTLISSSHMLAFLIVHRNSLLWCLLSISHWSIEAGSFGVLVRVFFVRCIDISFLAFAVSALNLFAMTVVAFYLIAWFDFFCVHFTVLAHFAWAWALEGLLLHVWIRSIDGRHLSNMFESVRHLLLFSSHICLHGVHWVLDRSTNIWESELGIGSSERWVTVRELVTSVFAIIHFLSRDIFFLLLALAISAFNNFTMSVFANSLWACLLLLLVHLAISPHFWWVWFGEWLAIGVAAVW